MVEERIGAFWKSQLLPQLATVKPGKSILFSAHKHVLRALVLHLAELGHEEIADLNIPNATPFVFEFDKD